MNNLFRLISLAFLIFLVATWSCSNKPDPREDVKKLIAAVDQSDTTALKESLDLNWIVNQRLLGVPEKDRTELFSRKRQELLDDLTGNGATRTSWTTAWWSLENPKSQAIPPRSRLPISIRPMA